MAQYEDLTDVCHHCPLCPGAGAVVTGEAQTAAKAN